MTVYYLLKQDIGHVKTSFILDHDYQPYRRLTGGFGFGQAQITLMTIAGKPVGTIHQLKRFGGRTYQLNDQQQILGQMTKLTGVWHQFAFVSQLNWTILGSIATNTYQTTHGLHTVFTAESTVSDKQLDGLKITLNDAQHETAVLLVAATLDQWVLLSERKPQHLLSPLYGTATN